MGLGIFRGDWSPKLSPELDSSSLLMVASLSSHSLDSFRHLLVLSSLVARSIPPHRTSSHVRFLVVVRTLVLFPLMSGHLLVQVLLNAPMDSLLS